MAERDLPPTLGASHRLLERGLVRVLVRRDWEAALPVARMLEGAPPEAWGTPVPHALRGRGPVQVLSTPRGEVVAKRLSRGGVVGALARHAYLDPARPLREAQAAEALAERGLCTPPVVAARATRSGLLWTLEVATARIASAGDLLEVLRAGGPTPALARASGRTLRRAHDAGLRHRDLQVKNLLVPAGFPGPRGELHPVDLCLLDLDRCTVGPALGVDERVASLARFARSLVKHGLLVRPSALVRLGLHSYGALPGLPAPRLLAAVQRRARRAVALHRWSWG
jgi:3-deoxy-D-manno-octulosonic acid kinase